MSIPDYAIWDGVGATHVASAPRRASQRTDPLATPADPALIARIGAGVCLRLGVLPWRQVGGATIILSPDPTLLILHAARLAPLGPLRHVTASPDEIRAGLRAVAGDLLVTEAENRVAASDSCRSLAPRASPALLSVGAVFALVILAAPVLAALAALVWASLTLVLTTALRLAALFASRPRPIALPGPGDPLPARLPVVSLLVPLFRETEIAAHLLTRLDALDYPRDRLDLCLIVEEEDELTRATLDIATLPAHAQVIAVPRGRIRTKPRALNFALGFSHGSIIGIYDAEDRPESDQLQRIVRQFARASPDVACLQGALDYYNHQSNWLARCFTLEYAGWFRVILPGLARLGLVVPLGGTTLFLRRHAIEEVGGWDAHNVTEDADLGVRLARRGYRTEIVATVTDEEANARAWPWVKQRTRWLKGYAMTWAVHSRNPLRLWRELGAWRFFGVQVLLFGTLSQFLLAPVVWSFWLIPLGVPHPAAALLPAWGIVVIAALFLWSEAVNLAAATLGGRRAGKGWLGIWAVTMKFYYPLATLAAWRAVLQALVNPFHWEKTAHGVYSAADAPIPRPARAVRPDAGAS